MKKSIYLLALALACLQSLSFKAKSFQADQGLRNHGHNRLVSGVELYGQKHFRGEYILINDDWSCKGGRSFCFKIRSIHLSPGYELWAFPRPNFRGRPIVIKQSWDGRGLMGRQLRGRIRSIRVLKRRRLDCRAYPAALPASGPEVILYDGYFQGPQISLKGDWSVGGREGFFFNDRISSIYVPRGYKVRLFEHAHFRGAYLDVYGDWSPGPNSFWNNRVSSVKVIPLNHSRTRGGSLR